MQDYLIKRFFISCLVMLATGMDRPSKAADGTAHE
jgi:hypothetical protein